jgi:hypothetical protein
MRRFFTLEQAEQILPSIEASIRRAVALKAQYYQLERDFMAATQRIAMLGGSFVNQEALLEQRGQRESCGRELKKVIEEVHEQGCLVKDLDTGLLDFPTLLRGQEVYLCWKLGENGISFWHRIDDGFAGRQPIDADFLANHKGEPSN